MSRETLTKTTVTKNLLVSVLAQAISLVVSFLLSMIVPKFIPVESYAHWQTFLLYASYVGILHFGLLDGIILRYSQFDYEELDKPTMCSQFRTLLIWTMILCAGVSFYSFSFIQGISRKVIYYIALSIITKNIVAYFSYLLQITNRISKYAVLTISQRVSYGLIVLLLVVFDVDDFGFYCLAELIGDACGILIGITYNKNLYLGGGFLSFSDTLSEIKKNISSGILLMIANWSSMLLTSGAKLVIQWRWDILMFGRVSFAFAISNLFLSFITALSVVVFPTMKRMRQQDLPKMYRTLREMISLFLVIATIFYFPAYKILEIWVPKYQSSLVYLGVLMPTMIFNSKVTLLTNNYLKAYRDEKKMLYINVISVVLAAVLYYSSAYVLYNMTDMLISVVIVSVFRSVISEIAVMKRINLYAYSDFVVEGIITVAFIFLVLYSKLNIGFFIYLIITILYCVYKRKALVKLFEPITNKIH